MDPLSFYKPDTLSRTRRVRRGDFGPFPDRSSAFPRMGTYYVLQKLINDLQEVPYCGSEDIDNEDIPEELRLILRDVPPEKKCMESIVYFSNRLMREQKTDDVRRLNGARYGEEDDPEFARLDRLIKAKRHLDRARQMYIAGKSLVAKGLSNKSFYLINRGRGMQYITDPDNPQKPRIGRKSALYELYQAYCLIRDYEMNPLPPLTEDGLPNPDRVKEDKQYDFIMGTWRMIPNRLGLGRIVRRIWKNSGIQDPNYYAAITVDGISGIDPIEEPDYATLYGTVYGDSEKGPTRVAAFYSFLKDRFKDNHLTCESPDSDSLKDMGYPNRSIITDMAHSLQNINENFIPPLVILLNPEEENQGDINIPTRPNSPEKVPKISISGPPTLLYPPCAPLGEPYPEGSWPFNGTNGRPNLVEPEEYIPVFFPTGLSFASSLNSEQRNRWSPNGTAVPPYSRIEPTPEHGSPDYLNGWMWDARISADLLASYDKRLGQQAIEYSKLKMMLDAKMYGSSDPMYTISPLPLTYWKDGKAVWEPDVIVPPKTYDSRTQSYFLNSEEKERSIAQMESDEDIEEEVPIGNYLPRYYGYNTHIYTYDPPRNLVDNRNTLSGLDLISFFPFGIKPYSIPQPTNFASLPEDKTKQNNLLQHALFLLSAPQNSWQKSHLPNVLLEPPPPDISRDSGSDSYGDSAPGSGYSMKNNNGSIDASNIGWRGYYNPFKLNPKGGIRGRSYRGKNIPKAQTALRTNGVPIGPLKLDPHFGESGHIPGINYNPKETITLWLIRTNQMSVMGENTWGLDFFGIS